jgi:RecJ-like exonuclease
MLMLFEKIKEVARIFMRASENNEILIISHHDTDGITSAAIFIKALKRLERKFSVKIVKGLEDSFISDLPKNKIILFLDLASNTLDKIEKQKLNDVFIIDHHEIIQEIPQGIKIINPQMFAKEKISSAGLAYFFCIELDLRNKDLAALAVVGMVGDTHEKHLSRHGMRIFQDAEVIVKRGLLLYPATRPLNRILEFNAKPYIPGVTGNSEGVIELLNETRIEKIGGQYKSLIDLDDGEMSRLLTAILLRKPKHISSESLVGNIYLVKIFGKLEDAREISAKINACSRLGESDTALLFCLENQRAQKRVETLYTRYKQQIITGLHEIKETKNKIIGKEYIIVNAESRIKDTIIGTIASILANSSLYEEGTIIVTMAYDQQNPEKIKVSLRLVGENGRNVRSVVEKAMTGISGEFGGHHNAAGCTIPRSKENEFIKNLQSSLEIEMIKV